MKGKKIIIVILLVVVSMGITTMAYKNFEGTKIEEIEEKPSKDNKLTFHVQQDSGSYTEYTSGKFPSGNYQVNQTKTTCTDVYGNKISPTLTYGSGSVTIKGSKTAYCEIYLDKVTEQAPTCTLSVSASGVTINPINAKEFGLISEQINAPIEYIEKTYNSKTTLPLEGLKSYFGFVKNSLGESYCKINVWVPDTVKGTCSYSSSGSGSGETCVWNYRMCECWNGREQWIVGSREVQSCSKLPADEGNRYNSCQGTCSSANGSPTWGGYTVDCSCSASSSSPQGYVCYYDGNTRGPFSTNSECESNCSFEGTSCSSGTQVSNFGGTYCWGK